MRLRAAEPLRRDPAGLGVGCGRHAATAPRCPGPGEGRAAAASGLGAPAACAPKLRLAPALLPAAGFVRSARLERSARRGARPGLGAALRSTRTLAERARAAAVPPECCLKASGGAERLASRSPSRTAAP